MLLRQGEVRLVLLIFIVVFVSLTLLNLYLCRPCTDEGRSCVELPESSVREAGQRLSAAGAASNLRHPQHHLCILVPFRDRFEELLQFAPHMKKFLAAQDVSHEIWVINQADEWRFNRAALINAGCRESPASCDYIAIHDVDLLPLNPRLSYAFPANNQPFHVASPQLHPKYDYATFIGGILLITRAQYRQVDGMSNKYWGWGLEDDEFFVRLRQNNIMIGRPENVKSGKRDTFKHLHSTRKRKRDNAKCYNQQNATRRRDRQTGLSNVNYTVASKTQLTVDGAETNFLNVLLTCDRNMTPWCNCTGAPADTAPLDRTRDEDVVVPLLKKRKS